MDLGSRIEPAISVAVLWLVAGCNQTPPPRNARPHDMGQGYEVRANQIAGSRVSPAAGGPFQPGANDPGRSTGSWVYHSKAHGFSLTLPSKNWKETKKKTHLVDFYCNPWGSPMLAGVLSAKKETREAFEESVTKFAVETTSRGDFLQRPKRMDGTTASGNFYAYFTLVEKGNGGNQFFYVACSHTWIKKQGLTVVVLFEGQGTKFSKFFKAIEYAEFDKAARAICLSVK